MWEINFVIANSVYVIEKLSDSNGGLEFRMIPELLLDV